MFENLFRFVDHSIRERDLLIDALNADKRDDDYQAKLKAFNNGTVSGHAPIGRTIKLISDINLAFGLGERDKAYQAATAEAIQSGLGLPLLRKLEAANSAHQDLCSQAMDLADQFAGSERLTYFTAHCDVFNALTSLVNCRAPRPDTGPGQWDESPVSLLGFRSPAANVAAVIGPGAITPESEMPTMVQMKLVTPPIGFSQDEP